MQIDIDDLKARFLNEDFDEYTVEIAAPKSYIPADLPMAVDLEPIVLPPWDPMGSLAG